jgi:hypothetical protein
LLWRERVLRITVEPIDNGGRAETEKCRELHI